MSNIIDGRVVAKKINNNTLEEIKKLSKNNIQPKLAVVLVGNDPASKLYVDIKEKKAKELGIITVNKSFDKNITEFELLSEIEKLNSFSDINAILVQLPLPKRFDTLEILNKIKPAKDVDALTPENLGKLLLDKPFIVPPTAAAILEILNYYNIKLTGKHVVIVGYGKLVGKPLAAMISLSNENATLTVCNHVTKNLADYTNKADILISATGVANLITENMIKKDAVVIDAGVSKYKGKICGDVDFENVKDKCKFITACKNGVGPVTVAKLLENVLYLTKTQNDPKNNI